MMKMLSLVSIVAWAIACGGSSAGKDPKPAASTTETEAVAEEGAAAEPKAAPGVVEPFGFPSELVGTWKNNGVTVEITETTIAFKELENVYTSTITEFDKEAGVLFADITKVMSGKYDQTELFKNIIQTVKFRNLTKDQVEIGLVGGKGLVPKDQVKEMLGSSDLYLPYTRQ